MEGAGRRGGHEAEGRRGGAEDVREAQAAKDRAAEGKDQNGSYLGRTAEAAKQTASEATGYTQDRASDAAQYTKDSAVAGKDKTGSVLSQVSYLHSSKTALLYCILFVLRMLKLNLNLVFV